MLEERNLQSVTSAAAGRVAGTYYRYDEELVVPIIENTPYEADLKVSRAHSRSAKVTAVKRSFQRCLWQFIENFPLISLNFSFQFLLNERFFLVYQLLQLSYKT